jgi:hypothetical protein
VTEQGHHEHDWMSVNEVARRTGHTRQWVHHRLRDGTFEQERKGRRIDVDGTTVHRWMLIERMKLTRRIEQLNLNMPYENEPD